MRNFIGNFLIALAAFISFLRNMLFFILTVGLVLGVLVITMIALLELISMASPASPYTDYQIVVLGKWYWCVIVFVIGASTMWLGLSKMLEDDTKDKPDVGKGWGNQNYNYGNKKI